MPPQVVSFELEDGVTSARGGGSAHRILPCYWVLWTMGSSSVDASQSTPSGRDCDGLLGVGLETQPMS